MPTVLIGGYYGAGNAGDEAILQTMIEDLRSHRSDLSLIVTSWNPQQTSRELGVLAIYWKDINSLLDAAQRADLIILGGGGIFHDYWGLDPETYLRKGFWDITAFGSLPLLARLLDIPCMIYAVGVGPFKTELARQHTRLAFERCQVATVRDEESLEFLRRTGFDVENQDGPVVRVLPDPVFSLVTTDEDDAKAAEFLQQYGIGIDAQLLGISLRYWDQNGAFEEWIAAVAEGIRSYLAENNLAQVIMLPFQVLDATPHTNDAVVLQKLAGLLNMPKRIHLIEETLSPKLLQALIKHCRVVLGMRLHSVIMSINVCTPLVALSYAPKVRSVMQNAGLEEFCNSSLMPDAFELASQIARAWNTTDEEKRALKARQIELSAAARQHIRYGLDLLSRSHRDKVEFPQQFALLQARRLAFVDEKLENLQFEYNLLAEKERDLQVISGRQADEIRALDARRTAEVHALSTRLREIESSSSYKLIERYHHLVRKTPVRYLHAFLLRLRHDGLRSLFPGARAKQVPALTMPAPEHSLNKTEPEIVEGMVQSLNARKLCGVAIVTSAFVFDQFYNQRIINMSKYLADQGWGVVYVAWRWKKEDYMPSIGEEVYPNVFQLPVDLFLGGVEILLKLNWAQKYFIVEFPYPDFFLNALKLQRNGFKILYEIIDEWEEFHKVGHALWFNREFENSFVVNADCVTAVSSPLIDKFSDLRQDIHLSPNGHDPVLLGINQRNIAHATPAPKGEFNLGYFGHLSASWFDWEFLFQVLDMSLDSSFNLKIHLIGYDGPDLSGRLEKYGDCVKLYDKVQPSELHKYVKIWDAALIWFKPGKLASAVDPIKIYEYLYFGLPVIVRGINHLEKIPATYVIKSGMQVLDILKEIQNDPLRFFPEHQVNQFLLNSTWERRFSDLLKLIESEKWIFS